MLLAKNLPEAVFTDILFLLLELALLLEDLLAV
jgi:hypothetical protein